MATISQEGFNFLKTAEGYSNVAYTLPGESYPTVGFGHHARDLVNGKRYSDTECMAFFKQDSKTIAADVNKIWHSGMTLSMFDAMFSLAYNHGNITRTTLGNTIKGDGYKNKSKVVSTWLTSYVLPGSRYEKGLKKRRVREANLFYSQGYDGNAPTPTEGNENNDSYYDSIAGVDAQYSSTAPSVLSTASSNIYSALTTDKPEDGKQRTRIYKYNDSKIELDEMSIPLDGNNTPVDLSTGQHYTDSSTNGYTDVQDMHAASTKLSGKKPDITLEVGATYPIIRINDYYFSSQEIEYMEIGCVGFIPTIKLDIITANNDLLKNNLPKEGDKVAVFCSPGHGMIKSLRCDFLITYVDSGEISQYDINRPFSFTVMGELFIPNLHNANMSFSFAGTSRDALIDAAEKLGLSFFFSDPDNTEDNQLWYCMAESDEETSQVSQGSNLMDYIKDTAAHAWKNFESFFDVWIDPRYGLSFININKMLGEKGPDEAFDITLFNDVFTLKRGVDNQHGTLPDSDKKATARPSLKLITNIPNDDEAGSNLYAIDFKEINQAAEITKQLGVSITTDYVISSQGVNPDNNQLEMTYSIPYNEDKYPNGGFYLLIGPGTNGTYVLANNGSYVLQMCKKKGGRVTDMMADSDGEVIADTGSNEMSTGNVNKFYDAAFEHNRINNMQLLKKIVKMTLNGANFAMMRGEKIPALILDNNKFLTLLGLEAPIYTENNTPPKPADIRVVRARTLNACTYTNLSGWFIIKSIKWIFTNKPPEAQSPWRTELELTRREWPIPGYMNVKMPENSNNQVDNNITPDLQDNNQPNQNNTNETTNKLNEDQIKPEDEVGGDVPLTGLKEFMKEIYKKIDEASGHKVKLVGARRYAVDTNGEKVEGNAFVKSGDKYKCKDAKGNIMYVSINNSRHLYGEAIDIINDGISYNELFAYIIIGNGDVLKLMYDHGVSAFTETSIDDMGTVSKHIHIGTDTLHLDEFWEAVDVYYDGEEIMYNGGTFFVDNYTAYNTYRQAEVQLQDTIIE